jgi:hypothetical protein
MRAGELNYSKLDLAEIGGRPKYFYRAHANLARGDWAVLLPVIEALGGRLRADWSL